MQPRKVVLKAGALLILAGLGAEIVFSTSGGPTWADESRFQADPALAYTSERLSNADIAWHALHTYGWPCAQVIERWPYYGYDIIRCGSGKLLRLYPRKGQHPRITNIRGTYSDG